MSEKQLTMFGAKSGTETFRPIAEGDVIVTHSSARHFVTKVDDNVNGAVFLTIRVSDGVECIVVEREVAYRSL